MVNGVAVNTLILYLEYDAAPLKLGFQKSDVTRVYTVIKIFLIRTCTRLFPFEKKPFDKPRNKSKTSG